MSAQFSRSSWASRDFPIPGSPTSSTSVPKPIRTGATEADETARSRSRSTNGSASLSSSALRVVPLPRASSPSTTAWTGSLFPFTENGSSSVDAKLRPPERRHSPRPDLVLACAGHEPGSKRSRVAEDRVGPAERRADLAGEDAALADADVDGQWHARVNDRAHRPEQPLLVVPERLGRARDEDDPSAVLVDVALEERHLVLLGGALHRLDEGFERLSRCFGTLGLDLSSIPEKRTKAMDACRCSPSSGPTSSSCARRGAGTAISSGMPATSGSGAPPFRLGGALSRSPGPSPRPR